MGGVSVFMQASISRIPCSDQSRSDSHLSRSLIAEGLKRFSPTWVGARSCTRVRILPFHPNWIGSSLFAPRSLRTTGVTRYV